MEPIIDIITTVNKMQMCDYDSYEIFDYILDELIKITQSEFGIIGEVMQENNKPFLRTKAITNIAWTQELRDKYSRIRGQGWDFKSLDTLFGIVLTKKKIVISNNPETDTRRGGKSKLPHGHPKISSFVGIPLCFNYKMIGMIGLANREGGYSLEFMEKFTPIYNICSNNIESYKTLNKILGQTSHDIKTPLSGIVGYCQLLKMHTDPRVVEYANVISNCSDILLNIVNDISHVTSMLETVENTTVNIQKVVDELYTVVRPLTERTNIGLVSKIPIDTEIKANEKLLKVALLNLYSNAIKYNVKNGTVISSAIKNTDSTITLVIEDSGVGIEKEDIKKIFTPLYRAKRTKHIEGNGLGLSVVKKYIENMGSSIEIESEVNKGTKVNITFKI